MCVRAHGCKTCTAIEIVFLFRDVFYFDSSSAKNGSSSTFACTTCIQENFWKRGKVRFSSTDQIGISTLNWKQSTRLENQQQFFTVRSSSWKLVAFRLSFFLCVALFFFVANAKRTNGKKTFAFVRSLTTIFSFTVRSNSQRLFYAHVQLFPLNLSNILKRNSFAAKSMQLVSSFLSFCLFLMEKMSWNHIINLDDLHSTTAAIHRMMMRCCDIIWTCLHFISMDFCALHALVNSVFLLAFFGFAALSCIFGLSTEKNKLTRDCVAEIINNMMKQNESEFGRFW